VLFWSEWRDLTPQAALGAARRRPDLPAADVFKPSHRSNAKLKGHPLDGLLILAGV